MMYVTHDAFRRDLGRFPTASAAGTPHAPSVRAGWENFEAQLLPHHGVEDTHLWPRVRRAAAGRPAGLALLDEMEAEHAQIDPLLAVVDRALVGSVSDLAANVAGLASAWSGTSGTRRMPRFPHPVGLHASGLARLLREMRRRQGVRARLSTSRGFSTALHPTGSGGSWPRCPPRSG